ncbi:uncharacterized protein [Drosophila takahashii]|uniref:uncharacterized protein n=1 Tax=Drosophila takahashii TaxID=29030 RepID=UPI0038991A91
MPNSYPMALKKLKCLEAKMLKDPKLKTFLNNTMQHYEEKRYIRKLEKWELSNNPRSWYLPIFTVTNPNKKKTRLVWDAAVQVDGISLNDTLLKGPDMLVSLMGVLLRFRERPIAVSGDIREMFHQIKVGDIDQFSQKFLWRNGETNRPPDTFVMQVMTFGAACSPSLANFILRRNAERFGESHPEAVKAICRNTFVDDWLESVDTEEQMVRLASSIKDIHATGGFEMRNWLSNSKRVVRSLNDIFEAPPKYLGTQNELQEKVLGMWWLPESDMLTIAYLIVEYHHRKYHHLHAEIVVNEIRQNYWIPGLRALAKEIIKNCPVCCIRRAQPSPPMMGILPKERLSPNTVPFTFTGVDYFGPIEVAVGRRREKRWGVLFTCLTVRAVHLELVPSLSTDSFLLALKLFTARRVERKYAELSFSFNPPGSPHMGGCWERMVRSTKSILTEILSNAGLREEVLRAALADVECTLNSRPLIYIPLESQNSEALTPNHFMVGNSSGLRERGSMEANGLGLAKHFRIAGQLADCFWKRWIREYLPTLTRRTKWFQPTQLQFP